MFSSMDQKNSKHPVCSIFTGIVFMLLGIFLVIMAVVISGKVKEEVLKSNLMSAACFAETLGMIIISIAVTFYGSRKRQRKKHL